MMVASEVTRATCNHCGKAFLAFEEGALALVQELAQALEAFARDPGDAASGPVEGCAALRERDGLPPELDPMSAYYQAGYLHEVSADNVFAFAKEFHPPVVSIAPFVCVRAALESSSIASWLAEPAITPRQRVARSMPFRKEGLVRQRKLAGVGHETDTSGCQRRIVQLDALVAQLRAMRHDGGNEEPLASAMPSTTELIRDCLGMEADYRVLSAVAHAHLWALQQVSFRIARDCEGPYLERKLRPEVVIYLCRLAAKSVVIPLRMLARQYGWKSPIAVSAP